MSFFADPWLFNCKNDADQRAIVTAISRASRYAQQHGVVMVAAQGNESIDLAHPVTDTISPDSPPGSELTRDVGNTAEPILQFTSGLRGPLYAELMAAIQATHLGLADPASGSSPAAIP